MVQPMSPKAGRAKKGNGQEYLTQPALREIDPALWGGTEAFEGHDPMQCNSLTMLEAGSRGSGRFQGLANVINQGSG